MSRGYVSGHMAGYGIGHWGMPGAIAVDQRDRGGMNPTAISNGIGQRTHRGHRYGQASGGLRPSVCPETTRGALPRLLVAEDRRWVDGLADGAADHERTCRDLHAVL